MGTGVPQWCDALSDVVFVFDEHQRLGYVNAAAGRLVGRPAHEFLGRTLTELADGRVGFFGDNPLRTAIVQRVLPHILAGGALHDDETTVLLADGSTGTFSWRFNPVRGDGGTVTGAVLVMRDMTELSNATFQAAPVGMFRVRGDGEVLEVNSAFRTLLELPGKGPLLRPLRDLVHPADRGFHDAMFTEFIGGGRYRYQAERRMLRADGTDAWCHITMNVPVRRMIPDGNWFDRAVGVVEDVSDRKRLEGELRTRNAELSRMARTDPLTGLYNRLHLEERLQEAVSAARRHGSDLSIVLADVDRFKRVNDCHGHQAGDEVLRVVAERVRSMKRAEDVCCRWGGEEFLVMLPNTDAAGAVVFAERLRRTVRAHPAVTAGGTEIDVTVSVGVASGTGDVSDLLRRADMALYAAKAGGRDRVAADRPTSAAA